MSLLEGQRNYRMLGSCEARFLTAVRLPTDEDHRDPGWRPLDPTRDSLDSSDVATDLAEAHVDGGPPVYYWRR